MEWLLERKDKHSIEGIEVEVPVQYESGHWEVG